ncbi:MAG: phage antirepressor KilAC domain-containing protein [Bacteroidaceae bacterium]|nr:phage antirepressor KilAC domain-containing protein [Bacteroidaceae bacterium]
MNTQVQVFNHEKFGSLRTMEMPNGQIGFVGKDVASALGYSNASKAVMIHVEDEDKVKIMTEAHSQNGNLSQTKTTIINESGLYALILSSKLPKAREFKHWVTSEVLPQIRKTGGYIPVTKEDDEKTILCKALAITQRTISERNLEIEQQEKYIQYLEPLAEYTQDVLESPRCYTMTDIAKFEGMTVQSLTRILKERHIIWRRCKHDPFKLFAEHHDKGYEAYRTKTGKDIFGTMLYTNTYLVWTERGRKFIHDYLKCSFVNEIA